MNETSRRFGIRTWSDVVSLGGLLLVGIGFIQWGLKVESDHEADMVAMRAENADLRAQISELKRKVGNGILPRAEERILSLEKRMDRHEEDDRP